MASSSSSPRNWRFNVFTSFHGPDVRQGFLSHLQKQFNFNGIKMFNDQEMERGETISPTLIEAIRESQIAIVLLSKNYASSSWCLNELLEILECKKNMGQTVMTVFYGVDPSHVRHQTGDFGMAFNETCARKTEDHKRKWSQALTYMGNIAGEVFQNWDNEAKMIEKIASDVSDKLNATPSKDFDGMVGLEGHLTKMESLLNLDNNGVKMVGISGPAGIGKSTIARALHNRLSSKFQHNCFVDNLWENYKSVGLDVHGLKLRLHEQLLSNILNQNGIQVRHLGVIKQRLDDKRVLIILDDVESVDQLEALANNEWFGPGSRVIVTTENKEILQQHGINDIYQVGFPSESEALKIFCQSAFRQTFPPNGFKGLANEVVRICGNLPLCLHVLGSSLRTKSHADWIDELPRLRNYLDGRIESVLKLGYDSLNEKDQSLFLYIAVFFNYEHVDHVTLMLAKSNLDVRLGLKILVNRYLIHIDYDHESRVVMHRLLQIIARQVISKQEPWKRQILVDAQEISYVLENEEGNGSTKGVSFDIAEINEIMISPRAFERMRNLLFLKVYNGCHTEERKTLHIPEDIKFPRSLRLFHWDAYPGKSLPPRFCPENLVKLNMRDSELEKLWEGTQPLANLKEMIFEGSSRLKKLPDLSKATNLEKMDVSECNALVEIPSSIVNLRKIVELKMDDCERLEVIPTLINLASLKTFYISGCPRLRSFPNVPTSLRALMIYETGVEELPASLRHCSRLETLDIIYNEYLKTFSTHLPTSVKQLNLAKSGIERITDCIKDLHNLTHLYLSECKSLASLPKLPSSLEILEADKCTSLKRVRGPLNTLNTKFKFTKCINLCQQARRAIIQGSFVHGWAVLPGSEITTDFHYRARGNSLTIPRSAFNRLRVCLVISQSDNWVDAELLCHCKVIGNSEKSVDRSFYLSHISSFKRKHLFICHISLPIMDPSEVSRKLVLKFITDVRFEIIECGVQILTDEIDGSNDESNDELDKEEEDDDNKFHFFL